MNESKKFLSIDWIEIFILNDIFSADNIRDKNYNKSWVKKVKE